MVNGAISQKSWILHHDNAPAHTPMLKRETLAKNKTIIMPQPPYSLDLASAEFFLYSKLKTAMKERKIARGAVGFTKNQFQKGFKDGKKTLTKMYYI